MDEMYCKVTNIASTKIYILINYQFLKNAMA